MSAATPGRISPLDPTATEPFYRQIYERFRDAIANGMLKPGDRIPSARALTEELGLARGTIETAYSLLAAEGLIEARGQAGTIVSPDLKPRTLMASPAPPLDFAPDALIVFVPIRSYPFRWACLPWMRFQERFGRALPRAVRAPCSLPI
ncbi:GntR family transcriptional regulator [Bradyrhizobium sp. LB13.1]